jgi:3-deoxy-D-manno-octulosonic-acid transferase
MALVNGRLSRRSYNRWRRNKTFGAPLFNRFNLVLAQNPTIARWFGEIGAPHVVVAGNLKIDAPPPPVDAKAYSALTNAIGGRPHMIAASTHEGEETVIAEAHRKLAQKHEGFLTIIAPRHPERGTAITEMLKGLGISVKQRSRGELPDARTGLYVADTIGELGTLYKSSPIAFVGGSLIPHGGQNPIEAVRHGAAVLTGPSWHNFPDIYPPLLERGGAAQITDADEIAAHVSRLIASPDELQKMQAAAAKALAELSGALDRTVAALFKLLDERKEVARVTAT